MYKIAYISNHPLESSTGVGKKILAQIRQWKSFGFEVMAFSFSGNMMASREEKCGVVNYKSGSIFRKRFLVNSMLISDLGDFCPDIVYYRYDLFSANYSYISKLYNTVVEVQTDDLNETLALAVNNKSVKYFFAFLFALCTRQFLFKHSQGIVAVTEELACSRRFTHYGRPTVAIPNGIHLSDYPIIKRRNEGRIQLFFIGTPGYTWHGVDIIEELAKILLDFDFHIVGIEGKNSKNMFYYGYMQTDEYVKIMQKCHVCIGSLALFRMSMYEASNLKVREYLASGFPVILGCKDTSFKNKSDNFLLSVDFSRESLHDIAREVHNFCIVNKARIVGHDEVSQIDSVFLESQRLAFLRSIIEFRC